MTILKAHKGAVLIQNCVLLLLCELNIIMENSITRDNLEWKNGWGG